MKALRRALVPLIPVAALLFAAPVATTAGARPLRADTSTAPVVTLVHQALALAPDQDLAIQVAIDPPLTADSQISVTSYQKVSRRRDFTLATQHHFGQRLDPVKLDMTSVPPPAADGTTTLTVHTESSAATADALRLPEPGVYPILVSVITGDSTSDLITFVDRLPGATDPPAGTLGVSVIASITAPPQIPGYDTPLPAAVAQQFSDLVAYGTNATTNTNANTTPLPITVSVSPELFARLPPQQLDQLRNVLGDSNNITLSQPLIPMDPSVAAASGRRDAFNTLLVNGEDAVTELGAPSSDRSAWFATAPLTSGGAALLRDLGVSFLVLPFDTYAASDNAFGGPADVLQGNGFSDFSQLTYVTLPDSKPIPATVIDPDIDSALSTSNPTAQDALYLAAQLVTWRDQIANTVSPAPVQRHSIVLGLSAGGVPNPSLVRAVSDLTVDTKAIEFDDLDRLARDTTVQNVDGTDHAIGLTTPPAADQSPRIDQLGSVRLRAAHVASMLVERPERKTTWNSQLDTLASSSITDAQVTATLGDINAQLDAIMACVVQHSAYGFTLSGLHTELPIRIENTCKEPLNVLIRMNAGADKLTFPDQQQVVELAPTAVDDVPVRVVARANGTTTVTLNVLSPDGVIAVVPAATLSVSVNQLTGLAQVITGAGLLILATWWARNFRRSRRARRAAAVAKVAHPAMVRTSSTATEADDEATDEATDEADAEAPDEADDDSAAQPADEAPRDPGPDAEGDGSASLADS